MNEYYDLLHKCINQKSEKLAVVDFQEELTYEKLFERSMYAAKLLNSLGVRKGDRVLILCDNSVNCVVSIFGCMAIGAIFVPLGEDMPIKRIQYIIDDCDCRIMITTNPKIALELSIEKCISTKQLTDDNEIIKQQNIFKPVKLEEQDTAFVIYTSGVIEPYNSVVFAVNAINSIIRNCETDRVLCYLPLSFDYGLYQIFLVLSTGGTLYLVPRRESILSIPALLAKYRITGFPLVPSIASSLLLSKLLKRVELKELRYITSTGDVFHEEDIDELKKIFPEVEIFPMYGLTECKRVSILKPSEYDSHKNSVGKPLPGTIAYVVDHRGKRLPQGETGVLIVKGQHVMGGYWGEKESEKFNFGGEKNTLNTGDLFKIDDGFLYFIGRDNSILKINGHRVSLSEIERCVKKSNKVNEICALGVEDKIRGQAIILIIYNKDGTLEKEEIRKIFYEYFSYDIAIKSIILTTTPLKKTLNGKIDRKSIKSELTDQILE